MSYVITRNPRFQRRSRAPQRSGQWDPSYLGLRALYDNRASFAGGMADRSGNGLADATVGAGSNSPLWLPYTRPNAHFPATSNWFATSAVVQAGNVIRYVWRGKLSASLSGYGCLGGQGQSSATTTMLYMHASANGIVYWVDSTDAQRSTNLSMPESLTQGWNRVTLDATANPAVITYERAPDADAEPTSWTFVRTVNSTAGAVGVKLPPGLGGLMRVGAVPYAGSSGYEGDLQRFALELDASRLFAWNAADMTQTGGSTGTTAWTASRPSTGRKLVVQSPAARSANGVWLFGTDDWIDVPAAAIPALDTFAAPSSFFMVFRRWHNTSASAILFSTKVNTSNAQLGSILRSSVTVGNVGLTLVAGDGTNFDTASVSSGINFGVLTSAYNLVGNGINAVRLVAGDSFTNDTSKATVSTTSSGTAGRIGSSLVGSAYMDMELLAYGAADRDLTDAELAQINAFYQVGT